MSSTLDANLRRALTDRVRYYNELGIYAFYRQSVAADAQDGQASVALTCPEPGRTGPSPANLSLETDTMSSDPATALRLIREDLGDCTRCRLHKQGRKQIVFGVGSPHAELMFIGEAPGADEDEQGEPFVGRAGELLTKMLAAIGLRREDVFITNTIKCRATTNEGGRIANRAPSPEEMSNCREYLDRELAIVKPRVILALGAPAAKSFLGRDFSITRQRGIWYAGPNGTDLIVTFHPAYILRQTGGEINAVKKLVWSDLLAVRAKLDESAAGKNESTQEASDGDIPTALSFDFQ